MNAEPRPVILDVDTGIDDMVALLIAATAPELNLRGVTCVAGTSRFSTWRATPGSCSGWWDEGTCR